MARAIFFDVDGVLIDGYHARPGALQNRWDDNLQRDLGVDPEQFKSRFIFSTFSDEVIVGKRALVTVLDEVLPNLGYRGATMDFIHYWLSHDSTPITPILDAVRQLRSKTASPVYLATNQEHLRANWLWQSLGFKDLFDEMFYSARLGVKKPDPAFFAAVEQRTGPFSEPPLFFDDSVRIVESARACGWEAVLVETDDDVLTHPEIAPHLQA